MQTSILSLSMLRGGFLSLLLIIGGFFFFVHPALALGLSPPTVEIPSILRNTTQSRTVGLYRAPEDIGNVKIHVVPAGENAAFIISGEEDIVMLSGQNSVQYEFDINPGDAPNGNYEVRLRFLKINEEALGEDVKTGNMVVTGVTAQILVTVGGVENLAYKLEAFSVDQTEVGRVVQATYQVSNTGNVDWRIEKIRFDFINTEDEKFIESVEVPSSGIEPVIAGKPYQQFPIMLEPKLIEGSYKVQAVFYSNGAEVGTLQAVSPLIVYTEGTLAQEGEISGVSVNKPSYNLGEKVKVDVVFQNTGEVDVDAVFVASVYRGDEVVDILRGKSYVVGRGDEMVFSEIYDPGSNKGMYTIEAYIEYGKRRTDAQKVSFEVSGSGIGGSIFGKAGSFANSFIGLGILVVLLFAGVILYRNKRKKKVILPPPPPPPPPPPSPEPPHEPLPPLSPQTPSVDSGTVDKLF
jgi:hypothetical protein